MSLESALGIAGSGVANVARELAIISRNVANASTPDYAREIATQTSVTADGVGMGVAAGPVSRAIDLQLQRQVLRQGGTVAGLATSQSALQAIDAVQGSPGKGNDLSGLLGALQDAFATLGGDPSSPAQQAKVVDAAATLARQVNALSMAYGSARQGAQDGIVADVRSANGNIGTIGRLSTEIVQLRAIAQDTADLENQRDAAMRGLATTTGVRFLQQPSGDVLAVTSAGLSLPLHAAAPLATGNAIAGTGASYPSGGLPPITLQGSDVTTQLTGGTLGARIALRDTTLPTFQAQLDQFAQTLASRFDQQGLALFTDPSGAVPTAGGSPTQASYVGFAGTIGVNPAVGANPALVRDGTRAVAANPAGASAFSPNPAGGPAGFSDLVSRVLDFTLGSQIQSGIAQAAVPVSGLGPAGTLAAGFASPPDLARFAATLVSTQSQASGDVSARLADETAVQGSLQSRLSGGSAVSIDTEMSSMLQLQNAYGANARILTTVQSMWAQLLQAIN